MGATRTPSPWKRPSTSSRPGADAVLGAGRGSGPEIDLLSLDVEGFERAGAARLDLARHAPRLIVPAVEMRAD